MRKISASLIAVAATVSVLFTLVTAQDKRCLALVLSGGANKGAYEAGVIHGLSHLLNGTDAYYDVVSGVSAGALNGAAVAMWAPSQAKEMSEWLINFWRNTTSDMIFQQWPGGMEEGFYNHSGIFDTTPLLNTLTETMAELGGVPQRKLVVASVDANTGEYVTFDSVTSAPEELPQRCLASASIPFVFPHQHIDGRVLMDGGTVWNTNMASAVDLCRAEVDDDSQITMDVVICSNDRMAPINATGDSIENFLRYWTISSFQSAIADVANFRKAYPSINYRYFFMASKPLASGLEEMDFSYAVLNPMIEIGMEDAAVMVNSTQPGDSFRKFDTWFNDTQGIRQRHPYLSDYLYSKETSQ
jgi:predicted acylesterase/phospholipase RssA